MLSAAKHLQFDPGPKRWRFFAALRMTELRPGAIRMTQLRGGALGRRNLRPRGLILDIGLILCIGALATFATGCAYSPTQSELKFLETRELHLPYAQAYDAALNAMFSMGLSITHTDKASGVISAQSGDHAMRATMRRSKQSKHPVKKVTLMITPRTDDLTQLRMKMLINEEQKLDRKLMTEIWQRIEREAMLDSGPTRGP